MRCVSVEVINEEAGQVIIRQVVEGQHVRTILLTEQSTKRIGIVVMNIGRPQPGEWLAPPSVKTLFIDSVSTLIIQNAAKGRMYRCVQIITATLAEVQPGLRSHVEGQR